MSLRIRKVTAFLTRPGGEVLVFEHPFAGIQFPAGSVEEGEEPQDAARREAWEETGLGDLGPAHLLGVRESDLPPGEGVLLRQATVYARPDPLSFNWAYLPRGIRVREERRSGDFVQVTYEEGDVYPEASYTTFRISGWVEASALSVGETRWFYRFDLPAGGPLAWEHEADHHCFQVFWALLSTLPPFVPPQDTWVSWLGVPNDSTASE